MYRCILSILKSIWYNWANQDIIVTQIFSSVKWVHSNSPTITAGCWAVICFFVCFIFSNYFPLQSTENLNWLDKLPNCSRLPFSPSINGDNNTSPVLTPGCRNEIMDLKTLFIARHCTNMTLQVGIAAEDEFKSQECYSIFSLHSWEGIYSKTN